MSNVNVMNELTAEEIQYNYEKIQRELYKLQIEISRKDKEIQALQSDLQVFKRSTNSTSSQFPFISEFKDRWMFLIQNLLMDTFDTIYSNSILLSSTVQMSISCINDQTKLYIQSKIILLLSTLGIVEHNEETIQNFFMKFRKVLLQDYYRTLFVCDKEFIDKTIDILKMRLIDLRGKDALGLNEEDKRDVLKDLNAGEIRKFIEEVFYICLYMNLHDPPLIFCLNYQPVYYYFSKSELVNIEGFAVDNSPCLLILSPPMLRNKNPYQGMKAAVYACENETITQEIMLQCHNNQLKKEESQKTITDSHYTNDNPNGNDEKMKTELLVEAMKKSFMIEKDDHIDYSKDLTQNNNGEGNRDGHCEKSSPAIVNDYKHQMITHYIKEKNIENNKGKYKGKGKDTRHNHHIEKMININTNNYIQSKRDPLTSHSLSKSTQKNYKDDMRSKSVNKPNQQCITKYIHKPLPTTKTNTTTNKPQPYTKHPNQSYISYAINNNSISNSNSNLSTLTKNKPRIAYCRKDKSYTVSIEEQKQHTNKPLTNPPSSRNSNHNHYDTSKSFDPSLMNDPRKSNGTAINIYLKTPLAKRRDSSSTNHNNDNQSCSSKNDTPNQSSLKHLRYNSNINSIIAFNNRLKKGTNDSEVTNSNNNSTNIKTSSIKKATYKCTQKHNEHTYTQGNVQRDISYNTKPKNYNHITKEVNHDSFSYRNSDTNVEPLIRHFFRNNNGGYSGNGGGNNNHHLYNEIINSKDTTEMNMNHYINNNGNNSSTNSLLANNSNMQQLNKVSSYQPGFLNPNQFLSTTTTTSGLNCVKGTVMTHTNKLEYTSTNTNNSKNSPTIIFSNTTGIGKGNDYNYKHITRTDYNSQPLPNSSTVTSTFTNQGIGVIGVGAEVPMSNRTVTNIPVAFSTSGDLKFNGLKKKGGIFPGAYKITDIQLNYDASSLQYQTNYSQSPKHNNPKAAQMASAPNVIACNQISSHNNLNTKFGNQLCHTHNTIHNNNNIRDRDQDRKQYPIQSAISKKISKTK